jgi:hypothetical protein
MSLNQPPHGGKPETESGSRRPPHVQTAIAFKPAIGAGIGGLVALAC